MASPAFSVLILQVILAHDSFFMRVASLLADRAAARYDELENRSATAGQREAGDDTGGL